VYDSRPVSSSDARLWPGQELERQDAHPDEVRSMDALEALGDDRPDAEQKRALGRPVAR
jgi:hypothetical protein